MEHTYASTGERATTAVGLVPTAVLSFVIMMVVVLQKGV
jgi:hypothetical protein